MSWLSSSSGLALGVASPFGFPAGFVAGFAGGRLAASPLGPEAALPPGACFLRLSAAK